MRPSDLGVGVDVPRVVITCGSSEVSARRIESLLSTLGERCNFIVARGSDSGEALASMCRRLSPVVVVVEQGDLSQLPMEDLREVVDQGDVRILILASATNPSTPESLLRKGCAGVIPLDAEDHLLKRAIDAVLDGELWYPRKALSNLVRGVVGKASSRELTRREEDIYKLIRLGLTNQQIADQLFITRETVRWHVRSLYSKLGLPNQRAAMRGAPVPFGERTQAQLATRIA